MDLSKSKSVTIYTDGACSSNGTNDAAAGIGVYWPNNESNNISERLEGRQTNQRAELKAAQRGIDQARAQGYNDVTVKTDSHYVKNGVESWMPKWEASGWSKDVVNKNEFKELKQSMSGINVKFEYVPSANNHADRLARDGAKKVNSLRRFIHH